MNLRLIVPSSWCAYTCFQYKVGQIRPTTGLWISSKKPVYYALCFLFSFSSYCQMWCIYGVITKINAGWIALLYTMLMRASQHGVCFILQSCQVLLWVSHWYEWNHGPSFPHGQGHTCQWLLIKSDRIAFYDYTTNIQAQQMLTAAYQSCSGKWVRIFKGTTPRGSKKKLSVGGKEKRKEGQMKQSGAPANLCLI